MPARILSATLVGIEAIPVTVEVDARKGLLREYIVGLPDIVIKESKNRVISAIKNSGFKYPQKTYTFNLAPAELHKEGPFFDLPMALGVIQTTNQKMFDKEALYVGELSLNGDIKPVRGIVSIIYMAKKLGIDKVVIPYDNLEEAHIIPDMNIVPVKHLIDLCEDLSHMVQKTKLKKKKKKIFKMDYLEIKGQAVAKRALEIAAAGKHNVLLIGSPGSGKTMLLKRLPSILPEMSLDEAIETQKVRSISNKKGIQTITFSRPFRSPHHSISYAGMVGGGSSPLPGEISLSNHGVLFLDELPEFPRNVIEVLRQPIEEKTIIISRAKLNVSYPANFMLVAAMNPCPCGYYRDTKVSCQCQKSQIQKYWKKISGPILDRIDIILEIPRLSKNEMFEKKEAQDINNSSYNLGERISDCRGIQRKRFNNHQANSEMQPKEIEEYCCIDSDSQKFLGDAIESGFLTGRSYHSVLKVARTIADLAEETNIQKHHIIEAIQYRKILRKL